MFCVLLYARVRLSELAFKIHLRSWSFPWRSSHLFCFSIQCFSDVSDLYLSILLLFGCILFNPDVSYILYSSFMNYYLFFFRCIIITLCLWSVIFIYCIFWDLPNFYLQRGILSNSIPAWVSTYTLIMDANGWKYRVVTWLFLLLINREKYI